MKQEQSNKEELEIRKASEELTGQDLEGVAGGYLNNEYCQYDCPDDCPDNCSLNCISK